MLGSLRLSGQSSVGWSPGGRRGLRGTGLEGGRKEVERRGRGFKSGLYGGAVIDFDEKEDGEITPVEVAKLEEATYLPSPVSPAISTFARRLPSAALFAVDSPLESEEDSSGSSRSVAAATSLPSQAPAEPPSALKVVEVIDLTQDSDPEDGASFLVRR